MNINGVKQYYYQLVEEQSLILSNLKKKIFQVGTVRLILVFVCACTLYFCWGNTMVMTASVIVSLFLFIGLMRVHSFLFVKKAYCEHQIKNAENELKGLDYDFSSFDGAEAMIDASHSYSLDLDLFGKRSFFQSLNRTVTSFGQDRLVNIMIEPLQNGYEIKKRQVAIRELIENPKMLAHFRAMGQSREDDNLSDKNFAESFSIPIRLSSSKIWILLTYLVPLSYLVMGTLVYFNLCPGALFVLLYILTFAISSIPHKKVGQIMNTFDKKSSVLDSYSELFKIIEDQNLQSDIFVNLKMELEKDGRRASKAISKLKSLHAALLMSETYPVLLFFNPILLWNVRYAVKIEHWIGQYKGEVTKWFASISNFDALVSLSIFAFNHPDYVFPEPHDAFIFKGKGLGHPLIHRDICIRNDINMQQSPYFLVITGANMAGKSTYLRAVGLNHTLACIGSVVCAEALDFYPGKLVTNLRTADSLADNESYFFAELKRLKMIIDRLKSGEELFIILDEILKGTNSVDKQKGSLALIKQLISLKGNGIIATHDLVLGTLEEEYPSHIKNYRFEADIKDNHLSFTYKIREGIAQNMNASFLMRQMGISGL